MRGVVRTLLILVVTLASCAPAPMLIGPPSSLPAQDLNFSAGASWGKPIDSSETGVPQLDVAAHFPVGGALDLAVRLWSLGGGIQGRAFAASRAKGNALDIMIAPLIGVGAALDYKDPEDTRLIGPVDMEFLAALPVVLGFGAGSCTIFVGGQPAVHMRPDLFVLRVQSTGGVACPIGNGRQIAPEVGFELPVFGGDELKPEDGFEKGVRRPPLLAEVVRVGVSFSF